MTEHVWHLSKAYAMALGPPIGASALRELKQSDQISPGDLLWCDCMNSRVQATFFHLVQRRRGQLNRPPRPGMGIGIHGL